MLVTSNWNAIGFFIICSQEVFYRMVLKLPYRLPQEGIARSIIGRPQDLQGH